MWRRCEGAVVKVCCRREIYGLFTTAELDVFPLVCLVGSSEAGPAYIKPGGDILSSEHAHSHHAPRSQKQAAGRTPPDTHPFSATLLCPRASFPVSEVECLS